MGIEIINVKIEKPEDVNCILGQAHFIKTVEDLSEALVNAVPGIKYGIAFNEASQLALVRFAGNDPDLIELAKKNALSVGAGHFFIIFIENGFPINVLNAIKNGARGMWYLCCIFKPNGSDRCRNSIRQSCFRRS